MYRVLSSLAAASLLVANGAAAPVPNHPQTQVKTLPKAAAKASKQAATAKTPTERKPYQIGMASWYGNQFHGRATASGEDFNMFEFTAAHRQLPLGTYVKVTNLSNG